MKILNSIWYTELGRSAIIGIIKCQDPITHKIQYYIGTGDGLDKHIDEHIIISSGAKFHPFIFTKET